VSRVITDEFGRPLSGRHTLAEEAALRAGFVERIRAQYPERSDDWVRTYAEYELAIELNKPPAAPRQRREGEDLT
jgi:hypothetical protein